MTDIPSRAEIVQIKDLKIDRNAGKVCKCRRPMRIVNPNNRQVYCQLCGATLDPFDSLLAMATWFDKQNKQIMRLRDQTKELNNYKPHLKVIRKLEKEYRGKKMLPNCPRCGEPFYLEELSTWTNKFIADVRIQTHKEKNS